ncbi:MAG: DegT/DnrJ/EryC1/StrS family aminotransferase [Candidatus Auribacterota bacterium]|jgi:dTDP-4-amino-4,6-dideoxygalactose transaminase|nr:DegT/DnrJ/EryC1/StrS family aminotransferase [Candidatus Auribacterota bacterium]
MEIPFINVHREYDELKDSIAASLETFFARGKYILGEAVEQFEQSFAEYCGCKFGIGVANGTDAIQIALQACGVKHGDEVITVANTAVPTVSAICATGALPVFVDIDAQTCLLDVNKLKNALSPKTRAVVPVHLYGQAVDMEPLLEFAQSHSLYVIEDCAQAHGALYKGAKVGSFGNAAAFSFYPTKNLGAYGDAGMVVTNDSQIDKQCRLLRNYGFTDRYITVRQGYNSRLDELQAGFLQVKLSHLDHWNDVRRELAELYTEQLGLIQALRTPQCRDNAKHVYHLYVIQTDRRDELRSFLADRKICTLIHYPLPIHLQEAYSGLGYKPGDLPATESVTGRILSLPLNPWVTEDEQLIVIDAIKSFFKR